jgi:dihydrofolate reductase
MSFAREAGLQRMSRLRFNISMSLDGFIAGPDPSEQEALGKRGEELHEWVLPLAIFRELHGDEGGEVNASTPVVEGWWENVGAFLMGRNMFGGGTGPWDDPPWQGWWGDEPPFRRPVFVLTHHAREPLELKGTTFHFVTDGIESALEQARDAAGGKDVSIAGGADVAQQYLAAGLIDEMEIAIVPVMLGGGTRMFENLGDVGGFELDQVHAIEAPGVVHLKYRVGG